MQKHGNMGDSYKFVFQRMQLQGLGKYEIISAFVTQNVFGNNSRKNCLTVLFLQRFHSMVIAMLPRSSGGPLSECRSMGGRIPFQRMQFQGLGKYETISVFVTQNVFGNNSRKNWLIVFLHSFIVVSLQCCRVRPWGALVSAETWGRGGGA